MTTRQAIADLWRQSAQITRADIFGTADSLRPVYAAQSALDEQIDVAAVGMVGQRYAAGGVVLLSVNPAGGSAHSMTNAASDEMYEGFRAMRSASSGGEATACLDRVERAVAASMPYWRITTQYVTAILDALGKGVKDIAYLYLVPFRTAGDAGSKMAPAYFEAGYRLHLEPQLGLLQPGLSLLIVHRKLRPGCGQRNLLEARDAKFSTLHGNETLTPSVEHYSMNFVQGTGNGRYLIG